MYNIAVILSFFIKKTKVVVVFICIFVASTIPINKFVFKLKFNGHEKIEKILSAIFTPIGLSMGSEEILYQGDNKQYLGFSNLFQSPFGFYFIFGFVDMIAYFLIAVFLEYLKKVDVKSIGIRKSQMKKGMEIQDYEKDIQEDPTNSECYVDVKNIYKFFKFRRNIVTDVDDHDRHLGKVFAANDNISFKM